MRRSWEEGVGGGWVGKRNSDCRSMDDMLSYKDFGADGDGGVEWVHQGWYLLRDSALMVIGLLCRLVLCKGMKGGGVGAE